MALEAQEARSYSDRSSNRTDPTRPMSRGILEQVSVEAHPIDLANIASAFPQPDVCHQNTPGWHHEPERLGTESFDHDWFLQHVHAAREGDLAGFSPRDVDLHGLIQGQRSVDV